MAINIDIDTKTDINELVRLLLLRNKITIAELARRMSDLSGKEYSRFNVRAKMEKGSLRFSEMVLICEILGYKLDIHEI
ncbi:unknown [Clostridium sp. CAG:967]|nr:unknown [Clostridium sp. CAG:967]